MLDRYLFIHLLIIAIFVAGVLCVKSGIHRSKKTWRVHMILGTSIVVMLSEIAIVCSTSETLSYIMYAVCFFFSDAGIFFLLRFCSEFTNIRKKHNHKLKWLKLLILLDAVGLFGNIFIHKIFVLREAVSGGETFLLPELSMPLMYHLTLAFSMSLAAVILLMWKLITSPNIYWAKYGLLLGSIILTMVLSVGFWFWGWVTDKSVLLYSLIAFWVYHTGIIYTPKELVHAAMMSLTDALSDALVMVDNDENCIYSNSLAKDLIGIEEGELDGKDILHDWCGGRDFADIPDFTKYIEIQDAHEPGLTRHIKIFYRRMLDERGRFEGSFFQMRDLTDEINHIEQDKYQATHDSLTGLYNRERFESLCRTELVKHPYGEYKMICLDVGNFKFVNDLFGPDTGDKVLIEIGRIMIQNAHSSDIYCRLGNDHFAILMPADDFNEDEFIEGNIDSSQILEELHSPLVVYTGVYHITDKTLPISVMCDRAHMAIDMIKGTDRVVAYYSEDIRTQRLLRQDIVNSLEDAINKGEIRIFLQAQTDEFGNSNGAEALVRWIREDGSMVFPNEFIPVLEECGAIARLDARVWELACERLRAWQNLGITDKYISVNISPKDFYYMDLYEHFTSLVDKFDINSELLRLEITETAIMMNLPRQLEVIGKLQKAGFIVEIDDFGSGYSSLNMLKDITVDVLKIDMAFLSKSENESRSKSILKLIIDLAHELDMDTVIEGVETAAQLEMLKSIGCDTFQGYYFSRPIPVEEYEKKFMGR